MGGFLLQHHSPQSRGAARSTRALGVFAEKGLPPGEVITEVDFELHLFEKSMAPTVNISRDGHDFAAATGTLAYHGEFGRAGLEALLADARQRHVDWPALEGGYCLLLCVGGQLRVLTDPTGLYPVYCDPSHTLFSSSFLAIAEHADRRTPNPQEIREYVFGAAWYGNETIVSEVQRLDSLEQWRLGPMSGPAPRPWLPEMHMDSETTDGMADEARTALLEYFEHVRHGFGDDVASALSGGYDTRLMLALLRRVGVHPYLYVYGRPGEPDVDVAGAVARACGLDLEVIERKRSHPEPSALAQQLARDYAFLDGVGHESGVFDDVGDLETRRQRAGKVRLQLNGGGGEVYRNFWQLPPGRVSIDDVVRTHFDAVDYSLCTDGFSRREYTGRLADKAREALGLVNDKPERSEIELLYPLLRLRYWQAKNNALNNQLTSALTPFAEAQFAFPSASIPVSAKNFGRFEASMIAGLDPESARLDSVYGHGLAGPVPLNRRLHDISRMYLPPPAMSLAKRRRAHRATVDGPLPYLAEPQYRNELFGRGPLRIEEWFRVDRLREPAMLARAFTVELLLRGYR